MDLALINKHWKEGFLYPFPEKRKLYKQLAESLEKRLITSVVGLRRTGKTTLLKQLINKLIQEGVLRQDIVLYSFDDSADLQTVINEYLKISGQDLDKKKLFFFLDEIQKFPDWHNKLKMYYDHYPTIKFVVSGSSSIFIRKNSESLAGRIQEFWLPPLSFSEFLQFRGKKELIEQQKLFAVQIAQELETFTGRQFIEIINENKEFADAYLDTLIKKIIFEDIPQVYPIEQPQVLLKLFRIIASNPGMLIDYHNLSSDLGINEKTLSNYSYYLEMAFLIKKLYNYSSNQLISEKKLKKVYPLASSFCQAEMPKIIEALVVTQLNTQFFWKRTHEVDVVLIDRKRLIPLEVKYKDEIRKSELKGLRKFMEEFRTEGIVATKSLEKKERKIQYIPVWKLLLQKVI
ncbi:MAG: ATP-binding protein [Nanoarchaeota archaeon]